MNKSNKNPAFPEWGWWEGLSEVQVIETILVRQHAMAATAARDAAINITNALEESGLLDRLAVDWMASALVPFADASVWPWEDTLPRNVDRTTTHVLWCERVKQGITLSDFDRARSALKTFQGK